MKTQVVPVEPTKKMLDAFDAQDSLHYNPANKSEQYKARHTWKAMLEAAPTPPTRTDNDKLRKAAEALIWAYDNHEHCITEIGDLRAALNRGES